MYRSPVDLYIDEWVYDLLDAVERTGARRVLIDSLTDLQFASPDQVRFREYMYSLVQRFSRQGVSLFMTSELPDLFRVARLSEFGVSHLSDNVVVLQYIRDESTVRRALTVLKTRASRHEPEIREFRITPEGIHPWRHVRRPTSASTGQRGERRRPPAACATSTRTCRSRVLVNDAETLELLHGSEAGDPLAHRLPSSSRSSARWPRRGRPQHVPELRHEARWWSATLHRLDTDRWGRVVVTLAVEVTDQVRARQLLEERERRRSSLQQAIAAVRADDLMASLEQVADALVSSLQLDAATIRLLDDDDAELHLVAASGLRPAERRRLALEPMTPRRLETIIAGGRHPLVETLGITSMSSAGSRPEATGSDR